MKENLIKPLFLALISFVFVACGGGGGSSSSGSSSGTTTVISSPLSAINITNYLQTSSNYISTSTSSTINISDLEVNNLASHEEDSDYVIDTSAITDITLNNISQTISTAGTYSLSGTIGDGQIIVEAGDNDIVKLILDGVDITSSTSAPIFIKNALKVIVFLEDGSTNTLEDSSSNEEKGVLLSKSNLTVTGNGTLNITSNFDDALRSNDGMIIKSGIYNISATDDAIRGKDYLIVEGGTFTLSAAGDGLKSDNEDDETRGYIYITGGEFNITAENDGVQAQTDLLIDDGTFNITTAGGNGIVISDDISAKGLKSDVNIVIDGGTFNIDSADDSIHTNDTIVLNAGTYTLASGDDAIHSDINLEINGGNYNVTTCYEGIESATVTINNGYINIVSSDDSINAAGDTSTNYYMYINGGFIVLNTSGDGLDANGYIIMNDGLVIVNGPTSSGDGAIDYDRTFNINGGILVATGNSRMSQSPSSSSSQKTIATTFNSTISSGTLVTLKNSSDQILLTFEASKSYQSLVFSSPDIVNDTHSIYTGGSVVGTSYDGIYKEPEYTEGSLFRNFTVSSIVTNVN